MHTEPKYDRRIFLKQVVAGGSALAVGLYASCKPADPLGHIKGSIVGANSGVGHLLRNTAALPAPSAVIDTDILIIGGGVSGLSAKRWLHRHGAERVMLMEMDQHFGGNAQWGRNDVSAYPWGAHYIPVPDTRNTELLDFFKEINVITGYDKDGLPIYNEYFLCMDPEERLFINGLWQEGIVPEAGVPENEKDQFRRFSALISDYKNAVGTDGLDAFSIPLDRSSADNTFRKLDAISFHRFLEDHGLNSRYLRWYLEYGCKDDYGSNLHTTSAWAGIHYFASRKGKGSNCGTNGVLTWPQGNGFLAENLRQQVQDTGIFSSRLSFDVSLNPDHVAVKVYDVAKKETCVVHAKKLLMATPQFVNKHLLAGAGQPGKIKADGEFQYAPWVIANITISRLPLQRGFPLCWDNVIFGTESVGYVNANQQDLVSRNRRVLTFYLPLTAETPETARRKAQATGYGEWLKIITGEMEYAHPGITRFIEQADLWIWGHGMISPRPGFIWGADRAEAARPIDSRIFFAHSDLSGISIFEEAFYQGITAANELINTL